MGRRHVGFLAALAAALALAAPSSAGLTWREFDRGKPYEIQLVSPVAIMASSRDEVRRFAGEIPANAVTAISRVDVARNVVALVFDGWGCKDHRLTVSSITQHGKTLDLLLAAKPVPAGTDCVLLYANYRAVAVPRSQLRRSHPTTAEARVARA